MWTIFARSLAVRRIAIRQEIEVAVELRQALSYSFFSSFFPSFFPFFTPFHSFVFQMGNLTSFNMLTGRFN
jgi:hypothetical protein